MEPQERYARFPRPTLFALVAAVIAGCTSSDPGSIIDVSNRLELFVDHYLIDEIRDVRLVMHEPVPAPRSDEPPPRGHYATVILDSGLYRMYNRAADIGPDSVRIERTEVFESTDGIHWSAPILGLVTYQGSKENNVILTESPFTHNFSPFLDGRPGVAPEEKYKALAGNLESGLFAFVSADGLEWRKLRDEPVFRDGIFDSQNVSFWSESEQMYVCYFRTWTGTGYSGLRTISRTTSADFVNWTDPVALRPNLEREHLYTSATHPYFRAPHIYVALPTRFHPDRGNATDILLMTSRSGDAFDRTFKTAFLRPGLDSLYWTNRANYAALNVVPTGESEMSMFVRGRRYTLRTDGFASARAGFEEGMLQTQPLSFEGDALILNMSTSASGYVLVELRDRENRPLRGFSLAEADTLYGDRIAFPATWQGNSRLAVLEPGPIRLRFVMHDADIFSLKFVRHD